MSYKQGDSQCSVQKYIENGEWLENKIWKTLSIFLYNCQSIIQNINIYVIII